MLKKCDFNSSAISSALAEVKMVEFDGETLHIPFSLKNGKVEYVFTFSNHHIVFDKLPGNNFEDKLKLYKELEDKAFRKWAQEKGIEIEIDKLPLDLVANLKSAGFNSFDVQNLKPEDILEAGLTWNGIIGFGKQIWEWVSSIKNAKKEKSNEI